MDLHHEILMPHLSDKAEEGVIVTWFVELGSMVHKGDLVAEIQVEKMSAEVRAPANGRIDRLLVAPGEVVAQGGVIGVIEEVEEVGAAGSVAPTGTGAGVGGAPVSAGGSTSIDALGVPSASQASVLASPAARRLARELGVDISPITGSGPDGRITEADIRATAARITGSAAPGVSATARSEPLTPMRRTIADRLRTWLANTAPVTLTAEADVTALTEELAKLSSSVGRGTWYTAAAARACGIALTTNPRVSARWSDTALLYPESMDIGIAVALEDGLVVPILRAANTKDLKALGHEIADLAQRARASRLKPAETEGGIFSITNLGAYGIDAFTPMLNPPQTAILGLGRARPRPAVVNGTIAVRTLMIFSLTFDHRVVDGAPAAAFLDEVVHLVENPTRSYLINAGFDAVRKGTA